MFIESQVNYTFDIACFEGIYICYASSFGANLRLDISTGHVNK
jgi:hypothetical protein